MSKRIEGSIKNREVGKVKIIEFFCGNKSFTNTARQRGHQCFTTDINPKVIPNLCIDILNFKIEMLPEEFRNPDMIWFSVECTEYSHAKRRGIRDLNKADGFTMRTLELIEEFKIINPDILWIIENPQTGLLKTRKFMQGLPFEDCSYCKYGMPYRKQTRFWNNFNLQLKTCSGDCGFIEDGKHIMSVGNGRKKYTRTLKFSYDKKLKWKIPEELCLEIIKQSEKAERTCSTKHVIPPKSKDSGILPNFT